MKRKPNSTINLITQSWELDNDFKDKTAFKKIAVVTTSPETPPKSSEVADSALTEAALENYSETSLSEGVESTLTTISAEQSAAAKTDLNSQLGVLSSSLYSATESSGLTQATQTEKTSIKSSTASTLVVTGSTSSSRKTTATYVSSTESSSTQNTTISSSSTTEATTTTTTPPGTTTPVSDLIFLCNNNCNFLKYILLIIYFMKK